MRDGAVFRKRCRIGPLMPTTSDNDRLLVFLRAPSRAGAASLRYQWQRNRVDLPCADRACVLIESTSRTHAASEYAVVIDDGCRCEVQLPAVLAAVRTLSSPPWRWPDLAAELRGQPDLFATLATAFRELCVGQGTCS